MKSINNAMVKNLPANGGDAREVGEIPGLGRSPWARKWQTAPVFLLENSMVRGAWFAKLNVTEQMGTHTHTMVSKQGNWSTG